MIINNMKNVDFTAIIFLIVLPIIAFVIGCSVSCFHGTTRWVFFTIGLACVLATAIYSITNNKIIDGGTF